VLTGADARTITPEVDARVPWRSQPPDVLTIRVFAQRFPQAEIAEAFGVAPHTVSRIVNGVNRTSTHRAPSHASPLAQIAQLPTRLMLFIVAVIGAGAARPPVAQAQPDTTMVAVDGGLMRAQIRGMRDRRPGQPIVILEAGAGAGLDTWAPIIEGVAALAPVVAYDRRGLGRSALDSQPQTLRRAATSLHMLLAAINAPPPYVLVGHSYGGVVIRAFAQQFRSEVSGLVYIDVPDIDLDLHRGRSTRSIGPASRLLRARHPANGARWTARRIR
jgi:hypothetical protein